MTMMNPSKRWYYVLLFLALFLLIVWIWKQWQRPRYGSIEGFADQDRPFVMKRDQDVYDDFYVILYDELMQTDAVAQFAVDKVVQMTQPSPKYSVFLDVGSGTGVLADRLRKKGYDVFGVDKSQAMVDYSEDKRPDVPVKCADVVDPMTYDQNTFTHVLCMGRTIYEIPDKMDFLRNCAYWIRPGGYLVLNMVDPAKYDTMVPAAKPTFPFLSAIQKHATERITETEIDFAALKYKSKIDFRDPSLPVITETFVDPVTDRIRQNERTLRMDSLDKIVQMAKHCGFIPHGQVNYTEATGDEYEYLVILERGL
jgi:SAM-dependent methyltransferase